MRKNRFALFAILAVFCFASSAYAQSDWYYGKPIKKVSFEGLVNVKSADLDGVTSSFIGKSFSDEVFADLLNRIYALDYFDDVSPQAVPANSEKSAVAIVFKVSEKPIISKITFSGNKQVRASELKEAIAIKEKDVYARSKMLIDERAVRNLYLTKGFTNVKVSSAVKDISEGKEVIFTIDEGQATVVSHILFQGNQVVASKTLKGKLTLKEVGVFNKGAFEEATLETDKQTIVKYYQERGYVDATVLDILQDKKYNSEKNRDELSITFVIQEGSQYTFGGLTFDGNKVFSTDQLTALVKIKTGSLFNLTKFQESLTSITDLYYENGYTSNQFKPTVSKSTDSKIISYKLTIVENPRSHVENIIVKGNTTTKEYVIKREITLEEGDIFSKAKLMTSMRNLYNLQYFSAIVPDFLPGSEENLVDIVFNVDEQSTRSAEFGLTFSGVTDPDEMPVSLYLKVQDSNLFGEGKSASVNTTLSTDEQSIGLSYGQNWLWNLPISTSFSLSYSHSNTSTLMNYINSDGSINDDDYYMGYEQHSFSLSASAGHRWTPNFAILTLSGGVSGSLIDNIYDSTIYTPADSSVSQYNNNWAPKNALYTSFSMDARDINYDPSSGWFLSQKLSWYGLLPQGFLPFAPAWGETEFYLRTDTKAEKYFTLINKPITESWALKLVLMGYSGLSFQLPIPGTSIGETNQMYIDGMFNGRGWSVYNSVRGQAMWSNIAELRMPVVPGVISTDLFFDAVTVKDNVSSFFTETSLDDWYFSFGPSIRFTIQQFPLRFLFASTFKFDNAGNFMWTDKYGNEATEFWDICHFTLSFNLTNK